MGRLRWDRDTAGDLDPATPAWFTIAVDKANGRPLAVDMFATAHFMHEDYTGFDAPLSIRPPR